jgi:hypothetical protein
MASAERTGCLDEDNPLAALDDMFGFKGNDGGDLFDEVEEDEGDAVTTAVKPKAMAKSKDKDDAAGDEEGEPCDDVTQLPSVDVRPIEMHIPREGPTCCT